MARPYHAIISDFEEAPGRQLFSPIFFLRFNEALCFRSTFKGIKAKHLDEGRKMRISAGKAIEE